jgi:5-methylcytosine-specific restriction protein B
VLRDLNAAIDDPHYEVGITFFLDKNLAQSLPEIWQLEIEPYLEEYFFSNRETVDRFRWDAIQAQL